MFKEEKLSVNFGKIFSLIFLIVEGVIIRTVYSQTQNYNIKSKILLIILSYIKLLFIKVQNF